MSGDYGHPAVRPGQIWRHKSGRLYTVLAVANDVVNPRPEYPPTVVYIGPNGKW